MGKKEMVWLLKPGVVAAFNAVGLSDKILIASLHDLSACTNSLASVESCLHGKQNCCGLVMHKVMLTLHHIPLYVNS